MNNIDIEWSFNPIIDKTVGEFFHPIPQRSSLKSRPELNMVQKPSFSIAWPLPNVGYVSLGLISLYKTNIFHKKGEIKSIVPVIPIVVVEFGIDEEKDLICTMKAYGELFMSNNMSTTADGFGGFADWYSVETGSKECPIFGSTEQLLDIQIRIDETETLLP